MVFFSIWADLLANMYIMKRAALSFLTSAGLVIILGRYFIPFMQKSKTFLQPIRAEGPETHFAKSGTPTMGGLLIMAAFFVSCVLWISSWNNIVIIILLTTLGFTLMGLVDDLMKLCFKNTKGLSGKLRLLLGFSMAIAASYFMIQEYPSEIARSLFFPYFSSFFLWMGGFYLFFTSFVIVGSANSVNLSDGLDGLASLILISILTTLFVLLMIILTPGLYIKFVYTSVIYLNNLNEVLVILAGLIGAVLGFIWYNGSPARIFMGDVGSLGLGAALGIIVVALKQEVFLFVAGLILVIESLSVITQVYSYKLRKKRIFKMAPIHHHFEKCGIPETVVVKRIWIFTVITCVLALLMIDIF